MQIALLILFFFHENDIVSAVKYENPAKHGPDELVQAADLDFSDDGRMYLVDQAQHKVFVWDKEGKFLKVFAQKGDGPGELGPPASIAVHRDEVWVNHRRMLSIFSLAGIFKYSFKLPWQAKSVIPFGKDLVLYGIMAPIGETGGMNMDFYLSDSKGKDFRLIKRFNNESQLTAVGAKGEIVLKAYAADFDLQRDSTGKLFFGFSYSKQLFSLSETGAIEKPLNVAFLDLKPTDEEKAAFMGMSFPMGSKRFSIKDAQSMGMSHSFDEYKAYYTQFTLKGDKALFILTPIGSMGVGLAYSSGQYYVCSRKSGAILSRGSYQYPEDSKVFSRSGRIIGVLIGKDGEYEIEELNLKGF